MRTCIWLAVLAVPGLALGDEPPAALPPGYEAVYRRCRETGRAMIVWVNVKGRLVAGAVGLECRTFPGVTGAGIVVGVWKGETLVRHDLPADAGDTAITALYFGPRHGDVAAPPVRVYRFVPTGWPAGICVGPT